VAARWFNATSSFGHFNGTPVPYRMSMLKTEQGPKKLKQYIYLLATGHCSVSIVIDTIIQVAIDMQRLRQIMNISTENQLNSIGSFEINDHMS
jgi:hypothetical protein